MPNVDFDPALTADRAAIVMFDALNGYLHPDDPQKEANLASWGIRENMQTLLKGARANGLVTFYPSGDHAEDGADSAYRLTDTDMELRPWGDRKPSTRPNISHGSEAAEVAAIVAPVEGDMLIPKHRWSSFFQTHLELQLRCRGLKTIVIAGGSSDVGIVSTVFAARDLDFGIVVVRDCCYSHRDGNNDFLMNRIFPRMGRVMTAEQAVALMNG